jgi:Pyridoxamine 5'-phosphate oxidase
MATWAELEREAPELAAEGRRLFYARGHGEAVLATVRGTEPPRVHPISLDIVDGHLYAFILRSAKRTDLVEDGRYALHAHQDPAAPDEFAIRGRARLVEDAETRARAAANWPFEADESYWLFEFSIDSALVGRRAADEWPPRYTSWSAPGLG